MIRYMNFILNQQISPSIQTLLWEPSSWDNICITLLHSAVQNQRDLTSTINQKYSTFNEYYSITRRCHRLLQFINELFSVQGMSEVSTTGGITSTWRSWERLTTWATGSGPPSVRRWPWEAASLSPSPGTGRPNPTAPCGLEPLQNWSWPCIPSASCPGDLTKPSFFQSAK